MPSRPQQPEVWRLLYRLLGNDCPAHVRRSDDSEPPSNPAAPRAIILPAACIPNVARADSIAEGLITRASGRLAPATRFVSSQLPELVHNALVHGQDSPTIVTWRAW